MTRALLLVGTVILAVAACSVDSPVTAPQPDAGLTTAAAPTAPGPTRIAALIDEVNATFEAAGSEWRLTEGWFFTVGGGTDPFRRLRTGARWPVDNVNYVLDASDYTTDLPAAAVDATLVAAYDTWNDVGNTSILASRVPDDGTNFDVIDGTIIGGVCLSLFDITSPNLDLVQGLIFPYTDIVVGGWPSAEYFSECLGSSNIIGVTWTFSGPDASGDNYADRQYVEQFYNPAFTWVTSGSVFLGPPLMDLESIAVHENGHAHGLGHFGGPNERQPFRLQPNGKVFDPEAVMNPFYLGGEKRDPFPTDVAGLRTLYARP